MITTSLPVQHSIEDEAVKVDHHSSEMTFDEISLSEFDENSSEQKLIVMILITTIKLNLTFDLLRPYFTSSGNFKSESD